MSGCFGIGSARGCFSVSSVHRQCFDLSGSSVAAEPPGRHQKKEPTFMPDEMHIRKIVYVGDRSNDIIAIGLLKVPGLGWTESLFRVLIEADQESQTFEIKGGYIRHKSLSDIGVSLDDVTAFQGFTAKREYGMIPSVMIVAGGKYYWIDSFFFTLEAVTESGYWGSEDYQYLAADQSGVPPVECLENTKRVSGLQDFGWRSKADIEASIYYDDSLCEVHGVDFDAPVVIDGTVGNKCHKMERVGGSVRWEPSMVYKMACANRDNVHAVRDCPDGSSLYTARIYADYYLSGDLFLDIHRGDFFADIRESAFFVSKWVNRRNAVLAEYDSTNGSCSSPLWRVTEKYVKGLLESEILTPQDGVDEWGYDPVSYIEHDGAVMVVYATQSYSDHMVYDTGNGNKIIHVSSSMGGYSVIYNRALDAAIKVNSDGGLDIEWV